MLDFYEERTETLILLQLLVTVLFQMQVVIHNRFPADPLNGILYVCN